jgi:simple sugar transport system substrate-binding protein
MKQRRVRVISLLLLGVLMLSVGFSAHAQEPKYRFLMISHIGSNDPNMLWLTFAIDEFERRFPEVSIDYISTPNSTVEDLVRMTREAIATNPDGIAIPIQSSEALDADLRAAIESGIPVVAFNIPDTRPEGERIPYLTYVGGDEYQTGVQLAGAILDAAAAGTIPAPTGAVCAIWDPGHQGLVARCAGFRDTLAAADIVSEDLDITQDPATAGTTMQSYLLGHENVNVIFAVTAGSGPWMYAAANELGLSPAVDGEGITMVGVDESPVSLEGVRQGYLLATHSQGFYLQGFTPFEVLYWNLELGSDPSYDVLSGPILIDSSNVDAWIPMTRNIFGDQYDTLSEGQWE